MFEKVFPPTRHRKSGLAQVGRQPRIKNRSGDFSYLINENMSVSEREEGELRVEHVTYWLNFHALAPVVVRFIEAFKLYPFGNLESQMSKREVRSRWVIRGMKKQTCSCGKNSFMSM